MRLFLLLCISLLLVNTAYAEDETWDNRYVVIWSWDQSEDKQKLIADNLADQASVTLDLWKSGRIENVYMNTEEGENGEVGFQFDNKSSFIFFIKANSESEAAEVLNIMPFVKLKLADYQLNKVGPLWLKQFEENSE